jgi:chromosomal replication initiation ATPase DnaA
LGDETFIEQTLGKPALSSIEPLPSLDKIEVRVCAVFGVVQTELASPGRGRKSAGARGMIGWLAMQYGLASLREVAERNYRDASTLTVAARKVGEKVRASEVFRTQVNAVMLDTGAYSTIQA